MIKSFLTEVSLTLNPIENVLTGKRSQIERLQERAAQELRLHVDDTYPDTPERFTRLLLKLPTLKALQPQVRHLTVEFVIVNDMYLCHTATSN